MAHLTSPGEYLKGVGGGAVIVIVILAIPIAAVVVALITTLGFPGLVMIPLIIVFSRWLAKRNKGVCKRTQ